MAFCSFLFVCLYLIQIHISEPISTDLGTRLPLRLEKVVGYVWTHNIPPFLPFRSLFSRAGAAFCTDDGCRFQVLPLNRDSRTRACDVTGVTFAELLHRLANPHSHVRVCVASTRVYMRMSGSFSPRFVVTAHSGVCVVVCFYHRVVTYSRHFVLRYLHKTFFCRLLSAFRRLRPLTCVCVCLNPRVVTYSGHFDLRYFDTFRSHTSISLQHPLLLMLSLSLFATCHPKEIVSIGRVSSAATKIALLRATATPKETAATLAYETNRAAASRAMETPQETEARLP